MNMTVSIKQVIDNVYKSGGYKSSLGYAYYICKPIHDYLNNNSEDIDLDFQGTNLRDPFVVDGLCTIITTFDEDLQKRVHIRNLDTFAFGTELDSLVKQFDLYQMALKAFISKELVQNMFN